MPGADLGLPSASDQLAGLNAAEAERRLRKSGPNVLPARRPVSGVRRVGTALREPLVLVLVAAMVLTVVSADLPDTIIIGLVVLINTALSVRQEVRADHDARALEDLVPRTAWVIRAGAATCVPTAELVPGDVVPLRVGDMVPADCRLADGVDLAVDESAVTGESLPVDKAPGGAGTEGLLWSGTAVVHGHGRAVVTATGPESTLGRIATLLSSSVVSTPLQRRMAQLSLGIAAGVVVLCVCLLVLGVLRGQPRNGMLLTAVSLAVAAVPPSRHWAQ